MSHRALHSLAVDYTPEGALKLSLGPLCPAHCSVSLGLNGHSFDPVGFLPVAASTAPSSSIRKHVACVMLASAGCEGPIPNSGLRSPNLLALPLLPQSLAGVAGGRNSPSRPFGHPGLHCTGKARETSHPLPCLLVSKAASWVTGVGFVSVPRGLITGWDHVLHPHHCCRVLSGARAVPSLARKPLHTGS